MEEITAGNGAQNSNILQDGPAPGQDGSLGARPIGRVLVVALDVPVSRAVDRFREQLVATGHIVSTTSFEEWRTALASIRPDVVAIEAADATTAVPTCRGLRAADARLSILAVLPDERIGDALLRADVQFAGADDFVGIGESTEVIASRTEVLLRLSNLGRELDASRDRLARHMQIDETTQLLNRRFFFQNSHRECSRARRYGHALSCLMIDIEWLDEMQKKFGYSCVEYVLRAVAYTVRQWTRDSDIVGRFNDRKFAILLPETDVEGATSVREKILDALDQCHFEWEGQEIPVCVSIGESERKREMSLADVNAPTETLPDEFGSEPLSVREELAALLEDADAALSVARRASLRPGIFMPYTPGITEIPENVSTPPNSAKES